MNRIGKVTYTERIYLSLIRGKGATLSAQLTTYLQVTDGTDGEIWTHSVSNVQDFKSCAFRQFRHICITPFREYIIRKIIMNTQAKVLSLIDGDNIDESYANDLTYLWVYLLYHISIWLSRNFVPLFLIFIDYFLVIFI